MFGECFEELFGGVDETCEEESAHAGDVKRSVTLCLQLSQTVATHGTPVTKEQFTRLTAKKNSNVFGKFNNKSKRFVKNLF